jgi:quercetin dioxygenase-like cupin family protein
MGFAVVTVFLGLSSDVSAQGQSAQLADPLAAGWKGQATCEKLHEDDTVRILRCAFPPNVGHERHFHPSHYSYVLAGGKVRITRATGIQDVELKTGTGRFNRPIDWHELLSVGEQAVAFLLVEPKAK